MRILVALLVLASATTAYPGSLAGVLTDPRFSRLELAPLAPALADTVAATYPVASASSSVTYAYNPALETFERTTSVVGPLFGERAETIGQHRLDVGIGYSYVHLSTINGDDLGRLVNRPLVNGQIIVFPVPGGVTLRDGRFTNFLPVQVDLDLDVTAHVTSPSVTYGLTPDLDVNVTLPLLVTSLGVVTNSTVPDPRFPQFALPPSDPNAKRVRQGAWAEAYGIGDLLLRAKYVLRRGDPVDLAVGLGLRLPTGDPDDFQGTGNTHVQPGLIASRVIAGRFEPLLNVGIDLNANDVDRSVVRWAVGGTVQVVETVAASVVFVGRHELAPQAEPLANPFFFQIERNDMYDVSTGLRWRFVEDAVVSANVIVPLNRDGLRADVIPTVALEWTF